MSDDLPSGWQQTSLDELNAPTSPICYGVLKPGDQTVGGVIMLRVKDVYGGKIQLEEVYRITPSLDREFARSRITPGDLVISVQGSVGRVAIVPADLHGANISRTLARIRPSLAELAPWLWAYLHAPQAQTRMGAVVGGTTRDSLNIRDLRELVVPVAPLSEQHRIVEKVEALLHQVNRAKERLDRVPLILKRFRQSVLAAACSGELTKEWREGRNEEQEPWPGTSPVEAPDWLPDVPESWSVRRLEDVSERVSVGHVGPTTEFYCASSIGIPFVRSQNVRPSRLVLEDVQYITRAFHGSLRKSQLRSGDLLVVRVGANRGDTCVVPDGVGELNCANIVFARPMPGLSQWAGLYANSPDGQKQLQEMTTGSAQGVLNTGAVARLVLPLPPSAERRAIGKRVASLLGLADTIERRVQLATARADKLPQAILSKAFCGELVPTEAELARIEGRSYETAEDLLKRVTTSGAQATFGRKGRRPGAARKTG